MIKSKTNFGELAPHGKDYLYQWMFFPFGLKNALTNIQRVTDQVLAGLGLPNAIVMTSLFLV